MNSRIGDKRLLCVVTGASRGIGQAIALTLSTHASPDGSAFLLTATDQTALAETAAKVRFRFVVTVIYGTMCLQTF
jgi:short-subunit dehydrogenase